jgi:hypothetical protein
MAWWYARNQRQGVAASRKRLACQGVVLGRLSPAGSVRLRLRLRRDRLRSRPTAENEAWWSRSGLITPKGAVVAQAKGSWRRATRASRRDAARPAREQPKVRFREAEPETKRAAWGRRIEVTGEAERDRTVDLLNAIRTVVVDPGIVGSIVIEADYT